MSTVYYSVNTDPSRPSLSTSQSRSTSTPVPPQLNDQDHCQHSYAMSALTGTTEHHHHHHVKHTLSPIHPVSMSFTVNPMNSAPPNSPALDANLNFSDSYDSALDELDENDHELDPHDVDSPRSFRLDDEDSMYKKSKRYRSKRNSSKSLHGLSRKRRSQSPKSPKSKSFKNGRFRLTQKRKSNSKRPRLRAKAQTVRVSSTLEPKQRHKFFGRTAGTLADRDGNDNDNGGSTKRGRDCVHIRVRKRYKLDDGREGVVHFIGPTSFAKGTWVGLVMDAVGEGNSNGTIYGRKYFTCRQGMGLFVRCDKVVNEIGGYVHYTYSLYVFPVLIPYTLSPYIFPLHFHDGIELVIQ